MTGVRIPLYQRKTTTPSAIVDAGVVRQNYVGDALVSAGRELTRVMDERQARFDTTVVREGDIALSQEVEAAFRGENGFETLAGRAALEARPAIEKRLKEARHRIESGLTGRQRELFKRVADGRELEWTTDLNRHTERQRRVWEDGVSAGREQDATVEAQRLFAEDPDRAEGALSTAIAERGVRLSRAGAPPEAVRAEQRDMISKIKSSVVEQALVHDPFKAAELLERFRPELEPAAAAELTVRVRASTLPVEGKHVADQILSGLEPQPAAADQDLDAIVRTVWGEARNQGPDGQRAVAAVILNRSREARMSAAEVVRAPGQFEPWNNPETRPKLEALDPKSAEYQAILANVRPLLAGQAQDPTGGATHFYAPKAQAALGRAAPRWDDGNGRDIGDHRFFRLGYSRPSRPVAVPPPERPGVSLADARRKAREAAGGDPYREAAYVAAVDARFADLRQEQADREATAWDEAQPYLQDEGVRSIEQLPSDLRRRLSPQHVTSLQNTFTGRAAETAKAAERADLIAAARLGMPLDPKDETTRKALDEEFSRQAAQWGQLSAPEQVQKIGGFVRDFGMAPSQVVGLVQGGLRSADPNKRLAAADLYMAVASASPQAARDFTTEEIAEARTYVEYRAMGLTAKEAGDALAQAQSLGKEQLQARDAAFTRALKDFDLAGHVRGLVGQDKTLEKDAGFWRAAGEPSEAMLAEIQSDALLVYRQTGNLKVAVNTAYDRARRVWGPTVINGARTFDKFMPERLYGRPELSTEANAAWIREQARDAAEKVGATADALIFTPVLQKRGKAGQPLYALMTEQDGVLKAVRGQDGRAVLFEPDFATSAEAKRRAERARRKEAELRKRHRGYDPLDTSADELAGRVAVPVRAGS